MAFGVVIQQPSYDGQLHTSIHKYIFSNNQIHFYIAYGKPKRRFNSTSLHCRISSVKIKIKKPSHNICRCRVIIKSSSTNREISERHQVLYKKNKQHSRVSYQRKKKKRKKENHCEHKRQMKFMKILFISTKAEGNEWKEEEVKKSSST